MEPNNSEVLECECSVLGVPYRVLFGKTKKMSFPKSLCGQCSPYLHKIEVSSSKLDTVTKTEWEERHALSHMRYSTPMFVRAVLTLTTAPKRNWRCGTSRCGIRCQIPLTV